MNKKLKKMLATVSAVAMSMVSLSSVTSYAKYIYIGNKDNGFKYYFDGEKYVYCDIPIEATSFKMSGEKYTLWPEAMDYFYKFHGNNMKIYRSEPNEDGYQEVYVQTLFTGTDEDGNIYNGWLLSMASGPSYSHLNEEEQNIIIKFLSENNINYELLDIMKEMPILTFPDIDNLDDYLSLATIITENTGISLDMCIYEKAISLNNIEVLLPEPTLSGDANKDGEVKLSDAVLVMQALSNPDEYQLTLQGIANADMDGDGITPMDALRIQEIALGK